MEVAAQRENFNCQQCRHNRHCDASNPAPFPMFVIAAIGMQSNTCPLPMITPMSHQLMHLFDHYHHRLLPFAGGLYDQPVLYIEAMEIIGANKARVLSEQSAQKHGH